MRSVYIMAIVLLLAAVAPRAEAHAFLDHSEPKVGSDVKTPPKEIKLWFTENLEPEFSHVKVLNDDGKQVDKKDKHLDKKDHSLMIVSVPKLAPGKYKVVWRAVSVDTHITKGHFTFKVTQ